MRLARLAGVGGIILVSGTPATTPVIKLVQAAPVVIAGSGYTAGAKFYVTYRSGSTVVRRRVVASLTGRYRVVLANVTYERCRALQLSAPGASLRVAPCTSLHGVVRIGPTTPVCRADVPCSKPAAHVLLSFSRNQERVHVRTDALGRYQVRLTPGVWRLTTPVGIGPVPIRFVVPRGPTAKHDFAIDTGIR